MQTAGTLLDVGCKEEADSDVVTDCRRVVSSWVKFTPHRSSPLIESHSLAVSRVSAMQVERSYWEIERSASIINNGTSYDAGLEAEDAYRSRAYLDECGN